MTKINQQEFDKHEERVYNSLERIEEKLDLHIERIVRVEEKVKGQQGTIKIVFSGLLAAISSIVAYVIKTMFGGE